MNNPDPTNHEPTASWTIDQRLAGTRVDLALGRLAGLSRSESKRALEEARVRLNGRPLRPADKGRTLEPGQTLSLSGPGKARDMTPAAQPVPDVTLIAQGTGWLMLDKPAGVPVHPLDGSQTQTLLNHAAYLQPQIIGVGEAGLRSGVVHRLDVETSGVVLMATDEPTWQTARHAFTHHQSKKLYRALVQGRVAPATRRGLSLNLTIAGHSPARVRVVPEDRRADYKPSDVRACTLFYSLIRVENNRSLLEVELVTGFLHQVRVMLAHIGHPVVNDPIYNPAEPAGRLMLHARELSVPALSAHGISIGPPELE